MFPLWLAIVIVSFVWLLTVKIDKHFFFLNIFYFCDYVTITHLIALYHDWSKEKLLNSVFPKQPLKRKTCNHFLKSRCISELSWNFLKNTNA